MVLQRKVHIHLCHTHINISKYNEASTKSGLLGLKQGLVVKPHAVSLEKKNISAQTSVQRLSGLLLPQEKHTKETKQSA